MKKIYDSVHRFIHIDEVENSLIQTIPFQRLHSIHQLGVAYFVYPGATHRRFEHSLGVMELASRIYDEMGSKHFSHQFTDQIPPLGSVEFRYWRRVLRLGALCHDLGHLPFSHVAEKRLLGLEGHEGWTKKIMESPFLDPIWDLFQKEALKEGIIRDVKRDIMKIALGQKKFKDEQLTPWEQILTEIVTGDFFGADRIDYLLRDSQCSGIAYGLFDYHQLIEMLEIIETPEGNLALAIQENGIESCEALLLARYYMHKRLYQYPSVASHAYHLSRFMETLYSNLGDDLETYIAMTDHEVLANLGTAFRSPSHPGHLNAKGMYMREFRFRAIPLSPAISEKDLFTLKQACQIPNDQISWEICQKQENKLSLNFFVLKRNGCIDLGDNLSEISVPSKERSWIYVAPFYEKNVREMLNETLTFR